MTMLIDDDITLKKLQVFLAFMRMNNLSRVSEELGQSVVSTHRAIHSLEEGLRCSLFRREGRRLIPLPTAYSFAEYATRAVDACAEGIAKVREEAGLNYPRIKIGSLYSLTLRCIPQIFINLKLRKPELDMDLTMGSNRELLKSLDDDLLDAIMIGALDDQYRDDIVTVALFDDELCLASPADSRYATRAFVDLQELRNEGFITLTDGFVTYESFMNAFQRAEFTPDITMRVGDIFSLINLVSNGIGYSLLPSRISEFTSRIKLIPLSRQYHLSQRIVMQFKKARERDPRLLALAAECRMYSRASTRL